MTIPLVVTALKPLRRNSASSVLYPGSFLCWPRGEGRLGERCNIWGMCAFVELCMAQALIPVGSTTPAYRLDTPRVAGGCGDDVGGPIRAMTALKPLRHI